MTPLTYSIILQWTHFCLVENIQFSFNNYVIYLYVAFDEVSTCLTPTLKALAHILPTPIDIWPFNCGQLHLFRIECYLYGVTSGDVRAYQLVLRFNTNTHATNPMSIGRPLHTATIGSSTLTIGPWLFIIFIIIGAWYQKVGPIVNPYSGPDSRLPQAHRVDEPPPLLAQPRTPFATPPALQPLRLVGGPRKPLTNSLNLYIVQDLSTTSR